MSGSSPWWRFIFYSDHLLVQYLLLENFIVPSAKKSKWANQRQDRRLPRRRNRLLKLLTMNFAKTRGRLKRRSKRSSTNGSMNVFPPSYNWRYKNLSTLQSTNSLLPLNSLSQSLKFDLEQCRNIKSILAERNSYKPVRRLGAIYIRICGIPESNVESTDTHEDTDVLSLNFVKEELSVDLKPKDINHSHRVGKRSSKPRPIIIRLSRHNTKVEILRKRKILKHNKRPCNVQEDLAQPRRDILKYLIFQILFSIGFGYSYLSVLRILIFQILFNLLLFFLIFIIII